MIRRRNDISIFLLAGSEVVRADFLRGNPKPTSIVREHVDVETNIVQSLRTVLESQGVAEAGIAKPGKTAIVLADSFWSQVLLLPSLSINGVEPNELGEALKFEAETLSGIDLENMTIGFTPLSSVGDQKAFWVTAGQTTEITLATRLLENAGCRNVDFFHPAGLAETVEGEALNELWGNLAFLFAGESEAFKGGRLVDIKPVSSFIRTLQPDLSPSDTSGGASSVIPPLVCGFGTSALVSARFVSNNLESSNELGGWLANVVAQHRSGEIRKLPTISLSHLRAPLPYGALLTGCVTALTLAFCIWNSSSIRNQTLQLQKHATELKKPSKLKKQYDAQLLTLSEMKTRIELDSRGVKQELGEVEFFFDNQAARFSRLLQMLVELRTPELVVTEIGGSEEGVIISGFSVSAEAAQRLAKKLRATSAQYGWGVNAAKQDGRQQLTNGGPWDFEILLTDVGPFNPNSFQRTVTNSNEQPRKF